jgi:hypothetical protein
MIIGPKEVTQYSIVKYSIQGASNGSWHLKRGSQEVNLNKT